MDLACNFRSSSLLGRVFRARCSTRIFSVNPTVTQRTISISDSIEAADNRKGNSVWNIENQVILAAGWQRLITMRRQSQSRFPVRQDALKCLSGQAYGTGSTPTQKITGRSSACGQWPLVFPARELEAGADTRECTRLLV